MKKNLLLLTMLIPSIYMYAQDTYIGSQAVVKVNKETLFYNGGNLTLKNTVAGDIPISQVVKNEGNIKINKAYHNTITNSKGEHFVNLYNIDKIDEYGQVIINGSTTVKTDGKLTMQKKSVQSSQIQQLPITFPFNDNVENIMYSFTDKTPDNFRGNCGFEVSCNQRYWMTLFKWNNNTIVNDAVIKGEKFEPGKYYLINIIPNTGLNTFYNGNLLGYKGTPAPEEVVFDNLKTIIPNFDENTFLGKKYSEWKNLRNKYNEVYYTYIGVGNETNNTSKLYGKNFYRLGNPYTSNISLLNPQEWINVEGIDVNDITMELTKLTTNYKHTWNLNTGSSGNNPTSTGANAQLVLATYSAGHWVGNPEAVLVRPFEMFNFQLNSSNANGELFKVKVTLNNSQKTFDQSISPSSVPSSRTYTTNEFYQLEVSLVEPDTNNFASEPVYLAGSNEFESEVNINPTYNGTMLLLEEDLDGNIIANAKTTANTFNSQSYIGKPLNLELNNLPLGNHYKLRFNLKENNIFTNEVENYSQDNRFYIHDKINDTFTELNGSSVIDINVTEQTKNQFAFYWKQIPRNLNTTDLTNKFKTQVYKYAEDQYKIKFDTSKSLANLEIYTVDGRKVSTQINVKISSTDEFLKIPAGQSGLYIVKVVYNDGTQNNIKVLVD